MELKEKLGMTGGIEAYSRPTPAFRNPNLTDAQYFKGGWELEQKQKNIFVNTGYNIVADLLANQGAYSSTRLAYFAWGDGTTTPAIADTATTFYADCANSDTKAITTIAAFDVPTKTLLFDCYLSSADNAVATIRKFALGNADPITSMFNELLFASPITKDATTEKYFRYSLVFSQV